MRILLLHSAYGIRPAVAATADLLRLAGYVVHVPDLYEGKPVASPEHGLALRDEIGMAELYRRAAREAAATGPITVYLGLSLGAWLGQELANRDPCAAGLIMLHGFGPAPRSPRPGMAVQLHLAECDAREVAADLREWQRDMTRAGLRAETFRYPRAGHLYTDHELDDYDAPASSLTWRRIRFLLSYLCAAAY
ncbi:dienelactone hydrolase [Longimycelium tulufanense]|uniref:Dienelactone hydrolase n=1 Tax=Longimycelium tulufanense TaxID=907463 RepID=A0A8J3CII9_9PSEU|nr:dienelactone hydrolase family protein [Longimycelium tulufanense]GGM72011.1 dienelactone hydrolase [Longimycelium tulufanense]